jgi:uncharacterized protein (DUF2249 family)
MEPSPVKSPARQTLDVRPVLARGEEPLGLIRARIDALSPGAGLTVVSPFLPAPLIELLRSEGLPSTAERRGDGSWAVTFRRGNESP